MSITVAPSTPENTVAELTEFFKDGGTLIQSSGGKAKARVSQMKMAQDLNRSFHERTCSFHEAPTGTGKTLGYIIPIGLFLRENPQQRFVISVSTKHLQAQIEEDLERMSKFYPSLQSHTVLKGISNYLCLNRLRQAQRRATSVKNQQELAELVKQMAKLEKMKHGWREELPMKVSDSTWSMICGESACCQTALGCFRKTARKQAIESRVVVVNSDLMGCNVKYSGEPIPTAPTDTGRPILVMDEAHTFLGRMVDIESADLSLDFLDKTVRTLQRVPNARELQLKLLPVQDLMEDVKKFFLDYLASEKGEQAIISAHTLKSNPTGKNLVKIMADLHSMISRQVHVAQNVVDKQEFLNITKRLEFSKNILSGYLMGSDNFVMLISKTTTGGRNHFQLALKPYELDIPLGLLWSKFKQVSLVSATLVGTTIEQVKKAFNANHWEFNSYTSPFNYPQQMRVFLPPKEGRCDAPENIARVIQDTAQATDGRVLALFTSYAVIGAVKKAIAPWCAEHGFQIYAQESGVAPDKLVDQYNTNKRAIILGNQSMGTGIDMSGLRAVIITKLPFDQFNPYQSARSKYLTAKGQKPFEEITLAETVRKFKQWIGRLVRREGQKGLIILLDDALNTQRYRMSFLDAIPAGVKCTHLYDTAHPLPIKEKFLQWAEPAPVAAPVATQAVPAA